MNFYQANKLIISLPKRADRRNALEPQLSLLGNYSWIDGVDGDKLLYDSRMPLPTSKHHMGLSRYERGRIAMKQAACRMAHQACIQIAKDSGWPEVVIIEDDADFDPEINQKLGEWINEVPADWQMLYFGAHNFRPLEMVSDHVGRCVTTLSTICYAIKNTAYDTILGALKADQVLDVIYCNTLHAQIPAYCFKPNLVVQRKGWSDIESMNVDYSKYYMK